MINIKMYLKISILIAKNTNVKIFVSVWYKLCIQIYKSESIKVN